MHAPSRLLEVIALASIPLLFTACFSGAEEPSTVELRLAATTAQVLVAGRERGRVPIESPDLDRVDVDLHQASGQLAVVVHHGRQGGATLSLLDQGVLRPLWLVTAPAELSAPRWSPDGGQIAVVRQQPARFQLSRTSKTPRLHFPGELFLIDTSGRRRRAAAPPQVRRPLGWDATGQLLLERQGPGELSNARVVRVDPAQPSVIEELPLGIAAAGHASAFVLRDGLLSYLRSDQPLSTAPGPEQRVERVVADPLGESAAGRVQQQFLGEAPGLSVRLDLHGPLVTQAVSSLAMPYIHQVYDTPNSFNGHWACGPTSTLMAIQHFGRLPKKTITVNVPSAHSSDYGAYVSEKYSAFGTTFNRMQTDPNGKAAYGAYGHCTENGGAWAWRMQDYAKKHDLSSGFSGSATFSAIQGHLAAGKVVALSTQLTSAGHIITVKGTTTSGKLIVNDPYGDRNLPSYPNTKGAGAIYSWAQVKAKWYITVYGTPTAPPKPAYKATILGQSFPATMKAGEQAEAWVKLRNDGTATWGAKTRLGTTKPRDHASAFFTAGSWLADNRAAAATSTAPGAQVTLRFTLTAPKDVCQAKTYTEYFGLLQEGVAWFSDSGQGGPKDDAIAVTIKVEAADADGDGSSACDDCDDENAAVHPGAVELCNGIDDNCDGQVDEGCTSTPDAGGVLDAGGAGQDADPQLPPPEISAPAAAPRTMEGGCSISALPGPPTLLWLVLGLSWCWRRRHGRCDM